MTRRPPLEGTPLLLRAMRFAAEHHRDHRRKGTIAAPYINHPIAVAEQLARAGLHEDIELLAAALLHDLVEDAGVTRAELEREFGPRVAAIVLEVTDDTALRSTERKRIVVETIAGKSREARLVKLSDLVANVADVVQHPPHWSRERTETYLDWAEAVVDRLRGVNGELERAFDEGLARARRQAARG